MLCRRDVFAVAEQWRAGQATMRALLVIACMWGNGSAGYGPARALKVLCADPDGVNLEHNLELVRGERPSEEDLRAAYQRFNSASPTHLRGLGPSFFTKLLYFAGYRRGIGGVQPLILDKRVASHLPAAAGPARTRRWGWSSGHWIAYLKWAAGEAARPLFGGESDTVEMALFDGEWRPDDR